MLCYTTKENLIKTKIFQIQTKSGVMWSSYSDRCRQLFNEHAATTI